MYCYTYNKQNIVDVPGPHGLICHFIPFFNLQALVNISTYIFYTIINYFCLYYPE